jgi:DNA-binding transcriptional regulator YhcF (GntR family)
MTTWRYRYICVGGVLAPGEPVPSITESAAAREVSVSTADRAIELLKTWSAIIIKTRSSSDHRLLHRP